MAIAAPKNTVPIATIAAIDLQASAVVVFLRFTIRSVSAVRLSQTKGGESLSPCLTKGTTENGCLHFDLVLGSGGVTAPFDLPQR